MRISDWSSDVCSSDLLLAGSLGRRLVAFGQRGADRHRLVRPELLNRRLAQADLADRLANILDLRHILGKFDVDGLAADEVAPQVQPPDRDQRARNDDPKEHHDRSQLAQLDRKTVW